MASQRAQEVAAYAYQAGFRGQRLITAVAIAGAETAGSYDYTAHNTTPPDDSYGPWQINMYGSLGPARRQKFGIAQDSDLFDPATNARAAFIVSAGGLNWKPWSTYKNGAYKKYIPEAEEAASYGNLADNKGSLLDKIGNTLAGSASGGPTLGIPNPLHALGSMLDLAKAVVEKIFNVHWWIRVGQFMLGMFMFGFGLYLLFRKQINGAVMTAAKGAALA